MQVLSRLNTVIFTWMMCLLAIVLALVYVGPSPQENSQSLSVSSLPTLDGAKAPRPLFPEQAGAHRRFDPAPSLVSQPGTNAMGLKVPWQISGEPWVRLTNRFEFGQPEEAPCPFPVIQAGATDDFPRVTRSRNKSAVLPLPKVNTPPRLLPPPAEAADIRPLSEAALARLPWVPPAPTLSELPPRSVMGQPVIFSKSVIAQTQAQRVEVSEPPTEIAQQKPIQNDSLPRQVPARPRTIPAPTVERQSSPLVRTDIQKSPILEKGWKRRRPTLEVAQLQPLPEAPSPSVPPVLEPPISVPRDVPTEVLIPPAPPALEEPIPLPFERPQSTGELHVNVTGNRISLTARDAPLDSLLSLIAQQHGLSIVGSGMGDRRITVTLTQVPLDQALDSILKVNGFHWRQDGDILLVSPLNATAGVPLLVHGRQMKVFNLNYITAADADKVVKGLLSPIGQSSILESSPTDKRRTQEQIVIEDLLDNLVKIESYLRQADVPPRQVLIEAKVFRVDLGIDDRHGVDLSSLAELANANLSFRTAGFANPAASPSLIVGMDGTDLDGVLELLRSTTNAKTLASPKVLAVNGQDARIQVGQQLGYFETTTTQTGTFQSVKFLDTGVVLHVTPIISDDGNVLMTVKPEVSSGQINATTGLPEEETSEVETTVLLADGYGMVIGGLIQEVEADTVNKIPVLGSLWGVGGLFRRTAKTRSRGEIIVALIPHIVPYQPDKHWTEQRDFHRATTPLVGEDLIPIDRRPLEPEPVLNKKIRLPKLNN